MLKIKDRGPTRRNRFLIFDGEDQVGVFGKKEDAEARLSELQFGSKSKPDKAKFKSSKSEK